MNSSDSTEILLGSLEKILNSLLEYPEVLKSPALLEQMLLMNNKFVDLSENIKESLKNIYSLQKELLDLRFTHPELADIHPSELINGYHFGYFKKYELLHDIGAGPELTAKIAKKDGVENRLIRFMLAKLFDISSHEARLLGE